MEIPFLTSLVPSVCRVFQIPVETLFGELARTAMENTFKKSVSMGVVLDE